MEDLARRDFTINAMALQIIPKRNSLELIIIDEFSGLADICDKRISAVRAPERTFRDDPIRQIRAIRFVVRLRDFGFQINVRTFEAIKTTFPSTFHAIPMEVLIEEVGRAFSDGFSLAFSLFKETNVFSCSLAFLDRMSRGEVRLLGEMFSDLEGVL